MNGFWECLIYLALIGVVFFIIGRILPKEKFSFERFPFYSFPIEKGGKIYQRVGVHKWKDSFPDMSRILPFLMPSKKMPKAVTSDQVTLMMQETCVAEWIHGLLSVLGFGCVFIWKGIGGWIVSLLYALGNIPYIIIQRYNRPKLIQLFEKLSAREIIPPKIRKEHSHEKSADTKLQYGRGA